MNPNGSKRKHMRRKGSELSPFNFNFTAFSINLGNMPQEQDGYLRILIAGSEKAITRKWQSDSIPSVSQETEIVQEMYLRLERMTSSPRRVTKKRERRRRYWKLRTGFSSVL